MLPFQTQPNQETPMSRPVISTALSATVPTAAVDFTSTQQAASNGTVVRWQLQDALNFIDAIEQLNTYQPHTISDPSMYERSSQNLGSLVRQLGLAKL